MIDSKILNVVCNAFGLELLKGGRHQIDDKAHDTLTHIWVHSIWVIAVHEPWLGDVILAAMHFQSSENEDFKKGFLLVPPIEKSSAKPFAGNNPLRTINLDWPDLVSQALDSVNTIPYKELPLPGVSMSYTLHSYTLCSETLYRFSGNAIHPNTKRLNDAIMLTIDRLAEIYNDEEISKFLKLGRELL